MLDGVRELPIIAGAYSDGRGGVCPMLAARRRGAPTGQIAFARAWDRFVGGGRAPRRVGDRELAVLVAHLEASLAAEAVDLGAAIRDHQGLVRARRAASAEDWASVFARLEDVAKRSGPPVVRRASAVAV